MKSVAAAALWVIALGATAPMARAIEEPGYTVVGQYDGFEVREYAPYLVAEVKVPGPADQAGNQGFRILAGYIFGRNKGDAKIAMTAPVTQAEADRAFVVQFAMPRELTLDELPEPLDPRVGLRQVPGGRVAVIRYSGTWSERNYREHLEKLERSVAAAGLRATGSPVYSRYDPPYAPWFMRRNEIWLPLD